MATNYFLAFAASAQANVVTDAQWAALIASGGTDGSGFTQGLAVSAQANKAWRQATLWAAVLGQIVADFGLDANDSQSVATLEANIISALASRLPGRYLRSFYLTGNYTPSPDCGLVKVEMVGGGGAGGGAVNNINNASSAGPGGAAGAYLKFVASVGALTVPAGGIPVTIGSAGQGVAGGKGGDGGQTSFGSYGVCNGGTGGIAGGSIPPGSSGQVGQSIGGTCTYSGGVYVLSESFGTNGYNGLVIANGSSLTPINVPGLGASSRMGQGGPNANNGNGGFASGYGAGGGGAGSNSGSEFAGGNGSPGCILVTEFS